MLIYSDVFNNDKILADSFPAEELYGGTILAVTGSYVIADEETQRMEVNIQRDFSLCQTDHTLRSFHLYIKGYSKRLLEYLQVNDPNRAYGFTVGFKKSIQHILETFDEYEFFYGESKDPTAMIILRKFDADDSGNKTIPRFYYFQDGLKGESVN